MKDYDALEIVVRNLTPRNLPLVCAALGRCGFIDPRIGLDYIKTRIQGELPEHVRTADEVAAEVWAVAPGADVHWRGYTVAKEWIEAGTTLVAH